MKYLVFDTGPVISLTTNNLLWILSKLKQKFKGEFVIAPSVRYELTEKPLETKKFKFEALQVEKIIEEEVLKIIEDEDAANTAQMLLQLANTSFYAQGNPIAIVQHGEMESIALALQLNADAIVVDERITRTLAENPLAVKSLLEKRLHTKITFDKNKAFKFQELTRHLKIIRSIELATIAYELRILDDFIVNIPRARQELLESVLWGVKLNGCSVSEEEIKELVEIEIKR